MLPSRKPLTTLEVSNSIGPPVERNSMSGEKMELAEQSRFTRNNLQK